MPHTSPNRVRSAGPQARRVGPRASESVRDERMADLLASEAGAAIVEACGGPKGIAVAADVEERQGRRLAAGDPANPINRAADLIRRSPRRWQEIKHLIAVAILADLEEAGPVPEWKVRQLWKAADQDEAATDAAEDVTRGAFDYDGSLDRLYEADAKAAGTSLRRMALGLICRRFGWDPRPTRRGA